MATRARIGIKQKSGRIIASYQHWDGYPGGIGFTLVDHWYKADKVAIHTRSLSSNCGF